MGWSEITKRLTDGWERKNLQRIGSAGSTQRMHRLLASSSSCCCGAVWVTLSSKNTKLSNIFAFSPPPLISFYQNFKIFLFFYLKFRKIIKILFFRLLHTLMRLKITTERIRVKSYVKMRVVLSALQKIGVQFTHPISFS